MAKLKIPVHFRKDEIATFISGAVLLLALKFILKDFEIYIYDFFAKFGVTSNLMIAGILVVMAILLFRYKG